MGEEYLLGGEEVSQHELSRQVLALAGKREGVALSLPAGLARAAARLGDRLRGHEAGAGYGIAVETLLREWRFSSAKALRDLEYRPLSWTEGLARTFETLNS